MILYHTRRWSDDIEEREYERTTECFAIKKDGSRDGLRTEWASLFRTRDEAIAHKRAQYTGAIQVAETDLRRARESLRAFNAKYPEQEGATA